MPQPQPDQRRRSRPPLDRTEAWLRQQALQVLVGDRDDLGLTIIDPGAWVLVETRRSGQEYPGHSQRLAGHREGWSIQVSLTTIGPGRWAVTFQPVATTPEPRTRQTALNLEAEPDRNRDAALQLRLERLKRPWHEDNLEQVTNVIHAELHGCAAIDVLGRPAPTGRYFELEAAAARAGRLVRHSAKLNGFNLGYDPTNRIDLDATGPI